MARQPTTGAEQALYIKQISERSRASREALSLTNRTFLNDALSQASIDIQSEIQSLAGLQTKSSAFQIQRLQVVQKNIDKIADDLQKRFKVFADDAVEGSYQLGIKDGISDLTDLKIPSYVALAADELDDLALAVFSVVDTSALDFLTRFQFQLLGDVTEDVRNGIKMRVASGIATGQSMPDIAREVGKVIVDPEEFRKAGKTVFKDAQTRIDLITRTETNRAHNQGRLKFYEHAGIRRVVWIATLDRRTAPLDESYHGQVFTINEVPAIPLHPRCRCTIAAQGPTRECEIKPAAEAAVSDAQGACCQTPEQIHGEIDEILVKDKKSAADLVIAKQALKNQQYDQLSSSQLRLACQQAGISIHRSKIDKLALLNKFEPGIDHSKLAGAHLSDALKKYKIGVLRSKSEMIALLKQLDSAVMAAERLAAVSIPDFAALTVKQLQDEAKEIGLVISKNKQQIIAEMNKINPNPSIPHIMLKGQDYQDAITKYGINKLKDKQQLIDELIETYEVVNKIAGVKGARRIVREIEIKEDVVADKFKDEKLRNLYLQKKQEYLEFFQKRRSIKAINDKYGKDSSVRNILRSWSDSTQTDWALRLKAKTELLEKGASKTVYRSALQRKEILNNLGKLSDEDYVHIRAFNQAYMESQNIDEVTLYRGTDGNTGKKIAAEIEIKKLDDITINDSSLSGYTPNKDIADFFGVDVNGITIRTKTKREEIFIHEDLFHKFTDEMHDEREFIIFGKKQVIAKGDYWHVYEE